MGLIKSGTISGTLPSEKVFAVHYPGYPSTTCRALETLGGSEGITKTRSSKLNKLELRFRPEDPYAHPALGELRPCNNFLLKISKKKSEDNVKNCETEAGNLGEERNKNESERSQAAAYDAEPQKPKDHISLYADVVAHISECYHFDGMADYQHVIAVHADAAEQKKRKWMEMEGACAENDDIMDLAQEDVMMLLPPLFAPKDVPEKLVLRPPAASASKKKEEVTTENLHEMDIEPGFPIDFGVKEIPKMMNWEAFVARGSEQWKWQVAVSEIFYERPIWPRESLTQRLLDKGLKFSHHVLNRFLLRVAYYFSNGPFLRFWIKRGYDPRKDPESRIYQRTDFRVPIELRSYCDVSVANKSRPKWEDICAFKVFPLKCQTFLQLFELDDDYIQHEIRAPPKLTACDLKTGWFSECMLDTFRLRVAVRFLSIYPSTGAEEVLKSIKEEFEKSKKMCIYKEVSRTEQKEGQEMCEGLRGEGDNENANTTNDGEEDKNQLDEEDEEVDAYEEFNLAGNDDEISLQSLDYLDMENRSMIYLQELFDSFPTSAADGPMHEAVSSEGEYQIYEQDSDGDISNDDNNDCRDDD